ncbi:MAG: glycosyltransferase family 2 protein, partial [Deltaproteobacteria bacterium]|nr:glycosyltransferase family 2 protein [Deltaproteobacteria bacterium]
MKLSVVIPVYNENSTVLNLLERVKNVPVEKEIILIDDYSTDGTRDILKDLAQSDPSLKIVFHEKNKGKGAALRTGFAQVAGDIVIIQDADMEYNPEEYPQIIQPILDGRADVVYGSRFLGGPQRVHLYWHYLGNKFFTHLSNMLTNINLTDMETCYKAF